MRTRTRRWTLIIGGTLIVCRTAGFAAFQFAIQSLKGQVEKALGPQGEVKEIRVTFLTGVEIIGIRIHAPRAPGKHGQTKSVANRRPVARRTHPDHPLNHGSAHGQGGRAKHPYRRRLHRHVARRGTDACVLPSLLEKPASRAHNGQGRQKRQAARHRSASARSNWSTARSSSMTPRSGSPRTKSASNRSKPLSANPVTSISKARARSIWSGSSRAFARTAKYRFPAPPNWPRKSRE